MLGALGRVFHKAALTMEDESMPAIHVYLYEGRTKNQKRDLAKAFTEAVEKFAGSKPEATHVLFHDMSKDDWANAGKLASDA